MIRFGELDIEGFCSIDHVSINLDTGHLVIIKGANGTGKSSILSSIPWVLYGTHPKGISSVKTWDSLAPKNYLGCKVVINFEKDGVIHKIIRCQGYKGDIEGVKGGNSLFYFRDGYPYDKKTLRDTQEQITKDLGVSYEVFMNTIFFGQGLKRLAQDTGANQKSLFDQIFDLSFINEARVRAQDLLNEKYKVISDIGNNITLAKNKISSLEETRNTLKNVRERQKEEEQSRKDEHEKRISSLRESLDQYKSRLNGLRSLPEIKKQIDYYVREDEKPKPPQITPEFLIEKITEAMNLIDNKQIITGLKILNQLIKYLSNKGPECNYSFKIKELRMELSRRKEVEEDLKDKEDSLEELIASGPKPSRVSKEASKSIKEINQSLLDTQEGLSQLEAKYNKLTLEASKFKWAIDKPLGPNGIKSFIFESQLSDLNDILRQYSSILDMHIEFGVKLEKARKDFYTVIEMNGCIAQYSELSGGQKQLVNISIALAMQQILAREKGIDLLFLDEVFESLCKENIEVVSRLISQVSDNKSIFLITHLDNLGALRNAGTWCLNYNNGLTTLQDGR